MGLIIIFCAMIIEIVLAVFCIRTKSTNQRIRSVILIGALLAFALAILTSVIGWGSRWYCLFALLLLWAIIGCIRLVTLKLQSKNSTKEHTSSVKNAKANRKAFRSGYTCGCVIRKAVAMFLLIAIASVPALIFPEHKPIETTGAYKVLTALYTYTDQNRMEPYTHTGENRKLNVEFWYPEGSKEQSCPLVVFSHGSFGIKTSNESLFRELASHGYVVCSIDHTYQCLFTTDADGKTTSIDMGFMKEVSAQDAHKDKQKSYAYYQKWMAIRTGDINFVIDNIRSEAKKNDAEAVYTLVDTAKIGVMGHSLGGSAALGIGRMRGDISAVVALESPFMCDIQGVKDDQFVFTDKVYPVPVLNVYSDSSWSHLSQWTEYAENNALLSNTNATAFNIHISGVGHLSLTDLSLTSPFLTRALNGQKSTTDAVSCLKTINKACLAFFDCYLKGEGKFSVDGMQKVGAEISFHQCCMR